MDLAIFSFHEWTPLSAFGLKSALWTIHIDTVICTWIAMFALFASCMGIVYCIKNYPNSMPSFIINYITRAMVNMTTETIGSFNHSCFTFAMGLFLFSFFCTLVSLIPGIEEATRDVNTTFALSLLSFLFVQSQGFKAHGLSHLNEYVQPFAFMLPMHIVGDLAKITSMSFRLFGNILAGSVILQLMFLALAKLQPYLTYTVLVIGGIVLVVHALTIFNPRLIHLKNMLPKFYVIFFLPAAVQLFFGLFEGLIQSGIIALLTLTYTGLTTNDHSSDS